MRLDLTMLVTCSLAQVCPCQQRLMLEPLVWKECVVNPATQSLLTSRLWLVALSKIPMTSRLMTRSSAVRALLSCASITARTLQVEWSSIHLLFSMMDSLISPGLLTLLGKVLLELRVSFPMQDQEEVYKLTKAIPPTWEVARSKYTSRTKMRRLSRNYPPRQEKSKVLVQDLHKSLLLMEQISTTMDPSLGNASHQTLKSLWIPHLISWIQMPSRKPLIIKLKRAGSSIKS